MAFSISDLFIYPIKSLGGISVDKAFAEKEGFQHDRRWMLVDTNGRFLSQREHHEMALFSSSLSASHLSITFDHDKIDIPLTDTSGTTQMVTVWDHTVNATEVDVQISAWFSDKLKQKCKLVRMIESTNRIKEFPKKPYKSQVSFADGYPYLILGTASMNLLNQKLDAPLNVNRFRPNIVVDTTEAHEEDRWEDFRINEVEMRIVKPCARCVVTTIDQRTGARGKEPLKTLAGYRKWDKMIYFGANGILLSSGVVNKGDQIQLS
ncbi:MAG: MOSC domain-containing protein [Saprospiraceae bacterium]|nr:MOSC domain-containing protein [Saprospiraceae bacterium]